MGRRASAEVIFSLFIEIYKKKAVPYLGQLLIFSSEFLVYSHLNRPNRNLALNNKNRKNNANKEGEGG